MPNDLTRNIDPYQHLAIAEILRPVMQIHAEITIATAAVSKQDGVNNLMKIREHAQTALAQCEAVMAEIVGV